MAPLARLGSAPGGLIRTSSPSTISALACSGTRYRSSTVAGVVDFMDGPAAIVARRPHSGLLPGPVRSSRPIPVPAQRVGGGASPQ